MVWGATPPMDRTTPVTPALLSAQGRQRDGTGQSDPPPYRPPPAAQTGGTAHGPPPPPARPAAHERQGPAPRGAHSPKPGRGTAPDHPHGTQLPQGAQVKGTVFAPHTHTPARTARGYQRPVPGPREVRTPHHPGGWEADAAGARAHTHAKSTRGLPEGQRNRACRTDGPRGMAYQRARLRGTRTGRPATCSARHAGREGGNGGDTTPGTGPNPPNRPRALRTHGRGTAPSKAVVAHCATPEPLG